MNIQEIKSAEWGMSLEGIGKVVEGRDDINQCIGIIIRTIRGTDPFRPLFGCDLFQYLDAPHGVAAPGMAKEIANAIKLWEPRVDVKKVSYIIEEKRILFSVDWKLIGVIGGVGSVVVPVEFEPENKPNPGPGPGIPTYLLATEDNESLITENDEQIII